MKAQSAGTLCGWWWAVDDIAERAKIKSDQPTRMPEKTLSKFHIHKRVENFRQGKL